MTDREAVIKAIQAHRYDGLEAWADVAIACLRERWKGEDAQVRARQALYNDSAGGTSDPTLLEMLAAECERAARLALKAAMGGET